MSIEALYKIKLVNPKCFKGFTEDQLVQLAESLGVEVDVDELSRFVTSKGGFNVTFEFSPDGIFTGVTAKIAGKTVTLFGGVGGRELQLFRGAPTNSVPGPGWQVDEDATVKLLNQPKGSQESWEYFYARRVSILNTF